MNLYEINNQIRALVDSADPVTGEIATDLLDQLQLSKEQKQENIIKFLKHLANDEMVVEKELERLKQMKATASKRREWLTEYLKRSMEIDGTTELDYVTSKAKIKLNPFKIVVAPDAAIPDVFYKRELVSTLDKRALKQALEEGVKVQGAELVRETRLDIS